MTMILGVLLGLGLLYVWLRGWWFAAVLMMPVVGLAITEFVLSRAMEHPALPVAWGMTVAVSALAWLPWWFHRARRQRLSRSLAGVQLATQDARFRG